MSLLRRLGSLCFLGLAACASVERDEYPATWPPLASASSGCPVLDGTYGNRGQGRVSMPLAGWLIEGSVTALSSVGSVRFAGPANGELAVSFLDEQGRLLAARRWREGTQYHCADGALLVDRSQGLSMVGVAMSTQVRLVPATDGSLVVETRETGGGLVLLVPYAGVYRYWSLFPAVRAPLP